MQSLVPVNTRAAPTQLVAKGGGGPESWSAHCVYQSHRDGSQQYKDATHIVTHFVTHSVIPVVTHVAVLCALNWAIPINRPLCLNCLLAVWLSQVRPLLRFEYRFAHSISPVADAEPGCLYI